MRVTDYWRTTRFNTPSTNMPYVRSWTYTAHWAEDVVWWWIKQHRESMIDQTCPVLKLRQRCSKSGHMLRCEVPGCKLHVIVRRQHERVPLDHDSASVVGGVRLQLMMRLRMDSCKASTACRLLALRMPIISCVPSSSSTTANFVHQYSQEHHQLEDRSHRRHQQVSTLPEHWRESLNIMNKRNSEERMKNRNEW